MNTHRRYAHQRNEVASTRPITLAEMFFARLECWCRPYSEMARQESAMPRPIRFTTKNRTYSRPRPVRLRWRQVQCRLAKYANVAATAVDTAFAVSGCLWSEPSGVTR